LSQQEAKLSLG